MPFCYNRNHCCHTGAGILQWPTSKILRLCAFKQCIVDLGWVGNLPSPKSTKSIWPSSTLYSCFGNWVMWLHDWLQQVQLTIIRSVFFDLLIYKTFPNSFPDLVKQDWFTWTGPVNTTSNASRSNQPLAAAAAADETLRSPFFVNEFMRTTCVPKVRPESAPSWRLRAWQLCPVSAGRAGVALFAHQSYCCPFGWAFKCVIPPTLDPTAPRR